MNFAEFLRGMGELHDSSLDQVLWRPSSQELELVFGDMYSNFLGLPDYPGKQPGKLQFEGVRQLTLDIGGDERLTVFEFTLSGANPWRADIALCPAGRISFTFDVAFFPELDFLPG